MAKKSKTQRAKASAARQAKKEQASKLETEGVTAAVAQAEAEPAEQKKSLFKRNNASEKAIVADKEEKAPAKKSEKDDKNDKNKKPSLWKRAIGFFKDVRGELKRVTWPTKQDVLRWSAVVVVALLFFGIYVVILDGIVTQILVGISGLSNFVQ